MMRPLLAVSLFATACARKRDPAPEEMENLAAFMIQHWDDERTLEEALDNLGPWLDENAPLPESTRGFRLTPLAEEHVDHLERPDADLSALLGASVAAPSLFSMEQHARTIVLDDQLFSNPRNYRVYSREVIGDADAFVAGDGMVETVNDIETQNFGVSIPYRLMKDYRWVRTRDREAIIARSWIAERSCNEGGGNCLEQSFSVDLWQTTDSGALRFTATWNQVRSSIDGLISEDAMVSALASGMAYVFTATDEFIEAGGVD